jgi:hypothetical protein
MTREPETAEQRYRAAFERLKAGTPEILPAGTPVSQNNIAKEAGADPSALRKTRYPALIREVQAWESAEKQEQEAKRLRRTRQNEARQSEKARLKTVLVQRDQAQSKLVRAHCLVLELRQEIAILRAKLNDRPPPSSPLL